MKQTMQNVNVNTNVHVSTDVNVNTECECNYDLAGRLGFTLGTLGLRGAKSRQGEVLHMGWVMLLDLCKHIANCNIY